MVLLRRSWDHRAEMTIASDPVSRSRGLVRRREGRVIAGVAAGLAARFRKDPVWARVAFVVLVLVGGSGIVLYVLGWLLLPWEGSHETIARRALRQQRRLVLAAAAGLVVLATLIVLRSLGLWVMSGLEWPAVLATGGLTLIWFEADEDDRQAFTRLADRFPDGSNPRVSRARIVAGVALVGAGTATFLVANHALKGVRDGFLALVGILGGLILILLPWWRALVRELGQERRERVRSQERAEVAAHLHDSVLQTLALIQRQADDPKVVVSLARSQERELRAWLFDGRRRARVEGDGSDGASFADAIRAAADEVEERHEVQVDAVTVGDCPLGEPLSALVAAAREAMVNAAKWSGSANISVYAEVDDAAVSVFVRDRGRGFDPSQVDPERRGIAESIRGRMARHGGTAVVCSSPGQGTDVELRLPAELVR